MVLRAGVVATLLVAGVRAVVVARVVVLVLVLVTRRAGVEVVDLELLTRAADCLFEAAGLVVVRAEVDVETRRALLLDDVVVLGVALRAALALLDVLCVVLGRLICVGALMAWVLRPTPVRTRKETMRIW